MPYCAQQTSGQKFFPALTKGCLLSASVAALLIGTCLSTPSWARGRGISIGIGAISGGGVGGAVGGVGGAVGGIGGSVGSISSGSLGSVGVNVGRGGVGGGSSSGFTGENFFSGAANFGNNATSRFSNGVRAVGQSRTRAVNRGSSIAAGAIRHKSNKVVEGAGQTGLKTQATAKKAVPALARSKTINVGGQNGVTATYTPDPTMTGSVRVGPAANPAANAVTTTGDGKTAPIVSTNAKVLDAPGANVGDSQPSGGVASAVAGHPHLS